MHKGQERKTAAAGQLRLRPFVCVPSMQFWGCVTAVVAKTLEQQLMTNNKYMKNVHMSIKRYAAFERTASRP